MPDLRQISLHVAVNAWCAVVHVRACACTRKRNRVQIVAKGRAEVSERERCGRGVNACDEVIKLYGKGEKMSL